MNSERQFGYLPMSNAPRNKQIFVMANQAPFDLTMFMAKVHFNADRDAWVVKNIDPSGRLQLETVNPVSWAPFMGSCSLDEH